MKKLFLSGVCLAALVASPVMAADFPAYKASSPPPEIFITWTGFYFGGNVGYSWGKERIDWQLFGFPAASDHQNLNGIIGGTQSGFNWQVGNWVTGMEIDGQWSGERGHTNNCLITCATAAVDATHKLSSLATARSRFGYLVRDNILVYATTGAAWGQVRTIYNLNLAGANVASFGYTNARVGWTAGAGVEYAILGNWTAKLEYLYVDLGSNTAAAASAIDPGSPAVSWKSKVSDNILRAGVNYLFH